MRAGPLSSSNVVDLLNRYYVPVFVSNEDFHGDGSASKAERDALQRIFKEGYAANWSVGSVHVYLVGPDGHLLDTLHVAEAAKTETLASALKRIVARLGTQAGEPVVAPRTQSRPPAHADDALVLHLTARRNSRGSWGEFPSENWIVLARGEWAQMFKPTEAKPGSSWKLPPEITRKILTHFHPQTEDCSDKERNRIDRAELKATVASVESGRGIIRLDGTLRMKRPFYHNRDDDRFVDATIIGFAEIRDGRVDSVQLTTREAVYGKEKFSVAVRTVE
jgi:hypothetical protein